MDNACLIELAKTMSLDEIAFMLSVKFCEEDQPLSEWTFGSEDRTKMVYGRLEQIKIKNLKLN